jgi:hypothetical protein
VPTSPGYESPYHSYVGGITNLLNVGILQRDYRALYPEGSNLHTRQRENPKSQNPVTCIPPTTGAYELPPITRI